jgi:hypothetical protein
MSEDAGARVFGMPTRKYAMPHTHEHTRTRIASYMWSRQMRLLYIAGAVLVSRCRAFNTHTCAYEQHEHTLVDGAVLLS